MQMTYKLGDYGCATCYNDRKFMGTLDYAAPEIIRSQSYDLSADMWSVGCIAYELNVNRPPFFNVDREETIRLITNVQYV